MKIKDLVLKNFHGFEYKRIDFNDQFTVLIGENATGKTALLDGISVALGGFLSGLDELKDETKFTGSSMRHIRDDEVFLRKDSHDLTASFESQFPVEVSCTAQIDSMPISWTRTLNGKKSKTTRIGAHPIIQYAKHLQSSVRTQNNQIVLPIISYFGTGRLWAYKREKTVDPFKTGSRFLGYTDCLESISNEKLFVKWFKKMTFIQLQKGKEPVELAIVRNAIENCLDNISENDFKGKTNIVYDVATEELQITLGDGRILPFRLLSDGYRNIIGIIADIAFRMCVLNPHLREQITQLTDGVVLIDEIDLHLHPKWQRHIVDDFKRIFPKVQFIATTHSPFIIQSLDHGELRSLDNSIHGEYVDKSIEDVAENVMGIELVQWSERKQRMYDAAKEYFRLLREFQSSDPHNLKILKQTLDELTKPFADNIAYIAFLEQQYLVYESKTMENKNETCK